MKTVVPLVFGLLLVLVLVLQVYCSTNRRENCKPLTTSFCQGLGYSTTLHPTGISGYSLQQISQMVQTACSPHIATLMCRVVVPECGSEDDSQMKPCRALCERVKSDCESSFKERRLYWPVRLRCDTLPQSNCVQVRNKWLCPLFFMFLFYSQRFLFLFLWWCCASGRL